jgi:hypothetical protein
MAINKNDIEEQDLELGTMSHYVLGEPLIDPEKPKFLEHPSPKKKKYRNYKIAEKGAPNREKPTTASAKKGLKDLPAAMAAVDPQGLSSIAPMMYKMLGQITSASKGSSQSSRKVIIEDALTGALSILSNEYSFERLTLAFNNALENNGIQLIDKEYRNIVKNALTNLYKNYVIYGEGNLPYFMYETVSTIGLPQKPLVKVVPDLYIQEYYTFNNDPYPGYIKWVSQDGVNFVFTERKIGDPYYTTPDEEVYSTSEQELAEQLRPYVVDNNLTARILNDLLTQQDSNVENNTAEKTGGKNSSKNIMSLLTQLAGYAGIITNLQQKIQLPISVLKQGSIKKSQESFMKNIGQLRQEKEKAKIAAQPSSSLSSLTNIASAVSNLSPTAKSLYEKFKS